MALKYENPRNMREWKTAAGNLLALNCTVTEVKTFLGFELWRRDREVVVLEGDRPSLFADTREIVPPECELRAVAFLLMEQARKLTAEPPKLHVVGGENS